MLYLMQELTDQMIIKDANRIAVLYVFGALFAGLALIIFLLYLKVERKRYGRRVKKDVRSAIVIGLSAVFVIVLFMPKTGIYSKSDWVVTKVKLGDLRISTEVVKEKRRVHKNKDKDIVYIEPAKERDVTVFNLYFDSFNSREVTSGTYYSARKGEYYYVASLKDSPKVVSFFPAYEYTYVGERLVEAD